MTRKKTRREDNRTREMRFGHYLVAFLDIMGQREALRRMKVPVTDGQEAYDQVLPQLKETAGKVTAIREMIQCTLRSIYKPTEIRKGASPEIRKLIDEVREPTVRFMRFSDTMVLFTPLAGKNAANVVTNVYSLMAAVSFTLISCFAGKTLIRGGIDIGAGIDIGKDEIYGAALERAYTLENHVADYPRIVVGQELLNYLSSMARSVHETPQDALAKKYAELGLALIVRDDDGLPVLDYLSEQVFEHARGGELSPKNVFDLGAAFAKAEYDRFMKDGNLRMASRYGRLMSFYEGHRLLWCRDLA